MLATLAALAQANTGFTQVVDAIKAPAVRGPALRVLWVERAVKLTKSPIAHSCAVVRGGVGI